ncbi:type II toxin-antitoxin system VapC family toxin [Georgenia subflava]|uniref:type II toxin-antitoxin system VapC family toxin n=1 Tax=Georgenia subflava TaxID=1622177 RepID=UPI00186B11BF|nr:PIN domain-containing protein [Georgenia subflava]
MIVLDASVIIAALNPREARHADAVEVLADPRHAPFLMHTINLAEVLVGAARAGRAAELAADLAGLGIVAAEPGEGEALALATLRVQTRLKMPDCCALEVAARHRAPLATLDGSLRDAARSRGLTTLP